MIQPLAVRFWCLWCLSSATMTAANPPPLVDLRHQIKRRRNQISLHRRNLQEGTSCQDLVQREELDNGGKCTCADESQALDAFVVSCFYPGCEGEGCMEDSVFGTVCARLTKTITYERQPTWGYYADTKYKYCVQYNSGRDDYLCFTAEVRLGGLEYHCDVRVNDSLLCRSCDKCNVYCNNIEGGDMIGLCSDKSIVLLTDSVYVVFGDEFFECLVSDDDFLSDAPSMEPSFEPSMERSMEPSMETTV